MTSRFYCFRVPLYLTNQPACGIISQRCGSSVHDYLNLHALVLEIPPSTQFRSYHLSQHWRVIHFYIYGWFNQYTNSMVSKRVNYDPKLPKKGTKRELYCVFHNNHKWHLQLHCSKTEKHYFRLIRKRKIKYKVQCTQHIFLTCCFVKGCNQVRGWHNWLLNMSTTKTHQSQFNWKSLIGFYDIQ